MNRIFKALTNSKQRRVLRHLFGVPEEDPPTNDFRNALIEGRVPDNIEEMETAYPMFDLLLMEGSRVQGVKILITYFLGDTLPFLFGTFFPHRKRHPQDERLSYVSRNPVRGARVCEGTNTTLNAEGRRIMAYQNQRDGTTGSPTQVRTIAQASSEIPPLRSEFDRSG